MNKGFTFIEIKTTGRDPVLDKIIFISLIKYGPDMRARKSFSSFINPEIEMSPKMEKYHQITNKELREYPIFLDLVDIIYPFIKENTLGSFEFRAANIIEFLQEELFMAGIRFKYLKRDFILIKDLEDSMYKRDVHGLYYKYLGKMPKQGEPTVRLLGDIFKEQCKVLGQSTETLEYSKIVKEGKYREFMDKYIYEVDGILYLNFGKHADTDVKFVPKNYMEWVLNGDFPNTVKEILKNYLKED